MILPLRRSTVFDNCTRGMLQLPDAQFLYTLELKWIPDPLGGAGGAHLISCVPAGTYELVLHDSVRHPRSFALVNPALGVLHEPDQRYPEARIACLLHVANTLQDLEGCIGLGMSAKGCSLASSKAALRAFNAQVPWIEGHTLVIS